MRFALLASLLLSGHLLASGQTAPVARVFGQQSPLSPEVGAVLGIDPVLDRLKSLQTQGQGASLEALNLRQEMLERIMAASFQVDDALGRIDSEASYCSEDRYVLQIHNQRQANTLNLITFAASGALGAAGSAMQLTQGLNHAGTALQAAAGGTSLVLSGVQLKTAGGRQPIRTPYNMLAELLRQQPNARSQYPPLVTAYVHAPGPGGQPSVAEGITAAWHRLHRLKEGPKGDGAPVKDLVADRSSNAKLTSDELADREAMLHDLHANVVLLRSDLQQVLQTMQSTQ